MLIVLEGVDSSGKETQTKLLYKHLSEKNTVMQLSFPDYQSNSSALVKMYLAGAFGDRPEDVSPYAASSFYAVDRYASYKTKWESFWQDGGIVVCDRYVTSNMVHQAAKLHTDAEKESFLSWIYDLEYQKLHLPLPDVVFFLDMPPTYALQLMKKRSNKITGKSEKDIHERDTSYLINAYENAVFVAKKYNWKFISCVENGKIREISDIHREIVEITEGILYGISSDHTGR